MYDKMFFILLKSHAQWIKIKKQNSCDFGMDIEYF